MTHNHYYKRSIFSYSSPTPIYGIGAKTKMFAFWDNWFGGGEKILPDGTVVNPQAPTNPLAYNSDLQAQLDKSYKYKKALENARTNLLARYNAGQQDYMKQQYQSYVDDYNKSYLLKVADARSAARLKYIDLTLSGGNYSASERKKLALMAGTEWDNGAGKTFRGPKNKMQTFETWQSSLTPEALKLHQQAYHNQFWAEGGREVGIHGRINSGMNKINTDINSFKTLIMDANKAAQNTSIMDKAMGMFKSNTPAPTPAPVNPQAASAATNAAENSLMNWAKANPKMAMGAAAGTAALGTLALGSIFNRRRD